MEWFSYPRNFMQSNFIDHLQTIFLMLGGLFFIQAIDYSLVNEVIKSIATILTASVTIYQIIKTNRRKRKN